MNRSRNVFLVGLPGVGKSTIGKLLSEVLKCEFFDTDQEIEARCGTNINWIFDIEGEEGFRKREQKVVHDLTELQGIVLATGGGCVLTKENRTRLSARGVVVYLDSDPSELMPRVEHDQRRPQLREDTAAGTRLDTLQKMAEDYGPLYHEIADMTIKTAGRSVRSVVNEIIEQLDTKK